MSLLSPPSSLLKKAYLPFEFPQGGELALRAPQGRESIRTVEPPSASPRGALPAGGVSQDRCNRVGIRCTAHTLETPRLMHRSFDPPPAFRPRVRGLAEQAESTSRAGSKNPQVYCFRRAKRVPERSFLTRLGTWFFSTLLGRTLVQRKWSKQVRNLSRGVTEAGAVGRRRAHPCAGSEGPWPLS